MRHAVFVLTLPLAFALGCGGHAAHPATVLLAPAPIPSGHTPPAVASQRLARPLVRVHFEGAREVSERILHDAVEIDKPKKHSDDEDTPDREQAMSRDEMLLLAVFYDRGYIQAKVESRASVAPDGTVDVTYQVQEGERFRLRALAVREANASSAPLGSMSRTRAGEWFSRRPLVEDIADLRRVYGDLGYANVDIVPETSIDPVARTIDVDVVIDRGLVMSYEHVRAEPPALAPTILAVASANGVAPGLRYSESNIQGVRRALAVQMKTKVDASWQSVDGKPDRVDIVLEAH